MKRAFEGMAQLGKEMQEKRDNKHIYDAVKDIKKPKIAELIPLLSEPLEKEGYIEFYLDKPEMGRDVYVGFSCLDSKSDRKDHDSRKTLKKLVDSALEDTNWRLMSDGISYRLGYLNGRVKAYESEEEVRKLVEQRMKSGKFPVTPANPVQTQDLGIKPELDMPNPYRYISISLRSAVYRLKLPSKADRSSRPACSY